MVRTPGKQGGFLWVWLILRLGVTVMLGANTSQWVSFRVLSALVRTCGEYKSTLRFRFMGQTSTLVTASSPISQMVYWPWLLLNQRRPPFSMGRELTAQLSCILTWCSSLEKDTSSDSVHPCQSVLCQMFSNSFRFPLPSKDASFDCVSSQRGPEGPNQQMAPPFHGSHLPPKDFETSFSVDGRVETFPSKAPPNEATRPPG